MEPKESGSSSKRVLPPPVPTAKARRSAKSGKSGKRRAVDIDAGQNSAAHTGVERVFEVAPGGRPVLSSVEDFPTERPTQRRKFGPGASEDDPVDWAEGMHGIGDDEWEGIEDDALPADFFDPDGEEADIIQEVKANRPFYMVSVCSFFSLQPMS